MTSAEFLSYIENYRSESGNKTRIDSLETGGGKIPVFLNEFWTSRQRQGSSIHEISYRACFKPQLPRFFIKGLTGPGDLVYDPFSGRGTTIIEAGLMNRKGIANDINPLSTLLARPRFFIPHLADVQARLASIPLTPTARAELDLSMFYHRRTEAEIVSLRRYLLEQEVLGQEDSLDSWLRMVATTRLSGHSPGFFSVYTLPPNQAVSPLRQKELNKSKSQQPEYREIAPRIIKKTASLTRNLTPEDISLLAKAGTVARFLCRDARDTPEIGTGTVKLTVTSPPFLAVVQYAQDNWLRCWFNGLDTGEAGRKMAIFSSLPQWRIAMKEVFAELYRVTTPGGCVAFEVGEVNGGCIRLDEEITPIGSRVGFRCLGIIINSQRFTKTANIWGVHNNARGTNTNRIVLFTKE